MSGPGDAVDPYTADNAREQAEFLRDISSKLDSWNYEAKQRIEATNAVRHPEFDLEYPDLGEAVGVDAELEAAIETINALADIFESAADSLDEENDDAAESAS